MALQFPNHKPDFIQIQIPDYIKNIQEFNTTGYHQKNYQTSPIGLILECKSTLFTKADSDVIINFYHQVKHQVFVLPANFLNRFPSSFIDSLDLSDFWEFSSLVQINPKIITKQRFISDIVFNIRNVLS
jgi:hypothetical protein